METEKDIKDLILACSDEAFNRDHLLSNKPWYFTRLGAPCEYSKFREKIGDVFKVTPNEVFLVGSGYFGLSLAPAKDFAKYKLDGQNKSDLDVVIISKQYFECIWRDLIDAYYAGQHYVYNRYAKTTFKKFVSFDKKMNFSEQGSYLHSTKLDRILKLYDSVEKTSTTVLRLDNEIKFRVYQNYEDVIAYHNWSIAQLRAKLRKDIP